MNYSPRAICYAILWEYLYNHFLLWELLIHGFSFRRVGFRQTVVMEIWDAIITLPYTEHQSRLFSFLPTSVSTQAYCIQSVETVDTLCSFLYVSLFYKIFSASWRIFRPSGEMWWIFKWLFFFLEKFYSANIIRTWDLRFSLRWSWTVLSSGI
jgi:hypothetical protein